MKVVTRDEFKEVLHGINESFALPDSPAWALEDGTESSWFVCVKPIVIRKGKHEYWEWCNENMKGRLCCYYSSTEDEEEWWGFTDKRDIVWWLIKWSH